MKPAAPTVILALALLGLGAVVLRQQQQITRERLEAASLRQAAARAAESQYENERLSQAKAPAARSLTPEEHNELLRLRSEVTRLRQRVEDLTARSSPAPQSPSVPLRSSEPAPQTVPANALTGEFLPAESWADVGFGTPEAALETMHWAMRHGAQDRMKQALLLPAGTVPAGAEGNGLDMIAFPADSTSDGAANDTPPASAQPDTVAMAELTGSRIVSRRDVSAEEVHLTVENHHADGTRLPAELTFRRVGGEWKLAPTVILTPGRTDGPVGTPP